MFFRLLILAVSLALCKTGRFVSRTSNPPKDSHIRILDANPTHDVGVNVLESPPWGDTWETSGDTLLVGVGSCSVV